jgi:hypothetical protein
VDNRTLVAFGMLLALVAFALQQHAVDGNAVEKIVTFLSGGITGAMVPRQMGATGKEAARAVAVFLLVLGVLFLGGCATGRPPSMGCMEPLAADCDDPTAYPPLVAQLPPWPFPRLLQPLPERTTR